MEIGKKLKNARVQSGMTQENVAEKINVSRQTISNWENEKSYPDIISVIELSNLYSISLDVLLKGDEKMIEHLEESTNVVKSNQKMIWAIIVNIIVVALLITLNMFIINFAYALRRKPKLPNHDGLWLDKDDNTWTMRDGSVQMTCIGADDWCFTRAWFSPDSVQVLNAAPFRPAKVVEA